MSMLLVGNAIHKWQVTVRKGCGVESNQFWKRARKDTSEAFINMKAKVAKLNPQT